MTSGLDDPRVQMSSGWTKERGKNRGKPTVAVTVRRDDRQQEQRSYSSRVPKILYPV